MKSTSILLICCGVLVSFQCVNKKVNLPIDPPTVNNPILNLKSWLEQPVNERKPLENASFAKETLTKLQAEEALQLLHLDKQVAMQARYDKQWDNRELTFEDKKMPFFYQKFGEEPADGRRLYISMHGGGGAPASVNDQQYENQKHLYDVMMKNMEGVYLAPRAPTNTWNLWHQSHIDEFFNIIIQMAVLKENVNPNKIYLLGYSAGGDGVYQLAPRMADRLAAASMMAGHPNDASPLSLRNLPFTIHMGGLDAAYKRNEVAKEWGNKLDALQKNDGKDAYIHEVKIHEGLGHWMKLNDKVAIPWMAKYQRNPIPKKMVWKQSGRHHSTFYWAKTPDEMIDTKEAIVVEYDSDLNEINIEENYGEVIELMINDKMLDLDKSVTIKYRSKTIYEGKLERSILNIYQSLSEKGDANLAFSSKISIKNNETVIK